MNDNPKITIGLPVFNGENYIEKAIVSILNQTYKDFRLVIVDNSSTDKTPDIARRYEHRDARVTYQRNDQNIGSGPNFNRAFSFAKSEYFKWAAHDDELESTYIERCVKALDETPSAVLAHSLVTTIDSDGKKLGTHSPLLGSISSAKRIVRFQERVMRHGCCTEVFGVIRAKELRNTSLIAGFVASDLSLLSELSLLGRFVLVPEALFLHREHQERYTSLLVNSDLLRQRQVVVTWFDSSEKRKSRQVYWCMFFQQYFRMVNRHVAGRVKRFAYYFVALRWLTVPRNLLYLFKDVLFAISPRLLSHALLLKRSISKMAFRRSY